MNSFYSDIELNELGLKSYGKNVLISRKCSIYGANKISIGNNVRIDDFCILSGNIEIGNYIHIAAFSALYAGKYTIQLKDFVGISSRCVIYAESDDYSGESLTNPMIPNTFRKTYGGDVIFNRHSILGSGCTVLPKVVIGEGASVGAMSLVIKDLQSWSINIGIPCKYLKGRAKKILILEKELFKKNERS